jgi:hypothetical protein
MFANSNFHPTGASGDHRLLAKIKKEEPLKSTMWVLVAALASPASLAWADITYVSATQTSHGFVQAFGANPTQQSYDLAAPDPLSTWTPPDQFIQAVADPMSQASLSTRYAAFLRPSQIDLSLQCFHGITASLREGAHFDFAQNVTISFSIVAPMPVDISASMFVTGPFSSSTPLSLTFGRNGDAPLINLSTGFGSQSFPLTSTVLQPGSYTLTALHQNSADSGLIGVNFQSGINFDLVPAPAATLPLLLGLGPVRRRRSSR